MRRCLIICALLLTGCGDEVVVAPVIPPDLLVGCAGHLGPAPGTEGQLVDAIVSEVRGRQCANRKIEAIAAIVDPQ